MISSLCAYCTVLSSENFVLEPSTIVKVANGRVSVIWKKLVLRIGEI